MDYELLRVTRNEHHALTKTGKMKRGFVRVTIKAGGEVRLYDLRGFVHATRKFTNWMDRTSGSGTYDIEWGA